MRATSTIALLQRWASTSLSSLERTAGLAWRNLLRNPRRTGLTVAAVVVGVWSSLVLASLARGLATNIKVQAVRDLLGSAQIHHESFLDDPSIDHSFPVLPSEVLDHSSIVAVLERLRIPGVIRSERESVGVSIVGIDPPGELQHTFLSAVRFEGAFLDSPSAGGIVIGRQLRDLLQTEVGRRVVLMTQQGEGPLKEWGTRVVGVFDAELESTELAYVFTGREALAERIDAVGRRTEISLIINEGSDGLEEERVVAEIARRIERTGDSKIDVASWRTLEPFVVALREIQGGFLKFWFSIVVLAVTIGLVNSLFMAVMERTREFGVMMALGVTPRHIAGMVVLESVLMVVAGAAIGGVLARISVALLAGGLDLSAFAASGNHLGFSRMVYPELLIGDVGALLALIVVLAIGGSLFPAVRAARLSVVQAIYGVHS